MLKYFKYRIMETSTNSYDDGCDKCFLGGKNFNNAF